MNTMLMIGVGKLRFGDPVTIVDMDKAVVPEQTQQQTTWCINHGVRLKVYLQQCTTDMGNGAVLHVSEYVK